MIHISTKIVYHIFFQGGDTLTWQFSNFSPKFVVYLHLTALHLCSVNHLPGQGHYGFGSLVFPRA